MYKISDKLYDNNKGYIYIPISWREEFQLSNGAEVGIDLEDGIITIDKNLTREYIQKITSKGKLTIPYDLRQKLSYQTYNIYIIHSVERVILVPDHLSIK
jgi:bifunctional DNA-binding transcriptional regulator/antitoxin component of YhaV-PrlF toxin-antitoxin module